MQVRIALFQTDPTTTYNIERPDHFNGYAVSSITLVCPRCLSMWAMLQAPGFKYWNIVSCPCTLCDCWDNEVVWPVPGSLLADWTGCGGYDTDLLDALPLELLKREFALTLQAYDKWNKPSKE